MPLFSTFTFPRDIISALDPSLAFGGASVLPAPDIFTPIISTVLSPAESVASALLPGGGGGSIGDFVQSIIGPTPDAGSIGGAIIADAQAGGGESIFTPERATIEILDPNIAYGGSSSGVLLPVTTAEGDQAMVLAPYTDPGTLEQLQAIAAQGGENVGGGVVHIDSDGLVQGYPEGDPRNGKAASSVIVPEGTQIQTAEFSLKSVPKPVKYAVAGVVGVSILAALFGKKKK